MKTVNLLSGFMIGCSVMAFTSYPQSDKTTAWLAIGIVVLVAATVILNAIDYWEDKNNAINENITRWQETKAIKNTYAKSEARVRPSQDGFQNVDVNMERRRNNKTSG